MTRDELASLIDRELTHVATIARAQRPVPITRVRDRILTATDKYAGRQYVNGVADVARRGRATVPDPGEPE